MKSALAGLLMLLLWVDPGAGAEVMRSSFPVVVHSQQCHDIRGEHVSTLRFDEMGDVGRAVIMNHLPFIVINPVRMALLPPPLQAFFYEHECAHHVLGHNYNPTTLSEREADCLAIKTGRDKRLFTRDDVLAFEPWIGPSRGSRDGHLPGPERLRFLVTCYDDTEPGEALAEAMRMGREVAAGRRAEKDGTDTARGN